MKQLEESLDQIGFRRSEQSHAIGTHKHAASMWQLRIRNESGQTLYFVNAYFYDKIEPRLKDAIEFEARLYPSLNSKHWISMEFHGCDSSPDIHTAMEFFRHAYNSLWCQPDPHNQ